MPASDVAAGVRAARGAALDRGIAFLAAAQMPSGQFPVEQAMHESAARECPPATLTPDDTLFGTAHVALALGATGHPHAAPLVQRAIAWLHGQMHACEVWRHYARGHVLHRLVPPDADDTACISSLFAQHAGHAPDNAGIFAASRDAAGRFYTWFIPRRGAGGRWRYWRLVLSDLYPPRHVYLWRRTPARPDDVDGVVNANVVAWLGPRPETERAIAHLIEIVRAGREELCDRWYDDRYVFYHALGRALRRGVTQLLDVRALVLARMADGATPEGRIGPDALSTALAIGALDAFDATSPLIAPAARWLAEAQDTDGGWPRLTYYYYGNPDRAYRWGSRALTTGFCVEALARAGAHA